MVTSKTLFNVPLEELNAFQKALSFVLKWEGVYSNDPTDPGGETKWGISKRAYPDLDIANLTPEDAAAIYYNDYWTPACCTAVVFPWSVAVFDTAVNCGVSRASNWLRESKNQDEFLERRKQHYIQLINKNDRMMKYWKGWMNRLNDLKKFLAVETAKTQS